MISPDKRTRPLPPGGLEQAQAVGRHRRRVALGAGGGTAVAAGVTALALVLTGGSGAGGSSSLQLASTPSPSAAPSSTATPTSPDPRAVATPAPSPLPTPTALTSVLPLPPPVGPTPTPKASAAPAQQVTRDHPMYTEHPVVSDAPAQCQSVPTAGAGPVFTGGASACATSTSDGSSVRRGGTWSAAIGVCSAYRSNDDTFGFRTGKEHDLLVFAGTDVTRPPIYRFSATVSYVQGAHQQTIAAGTCLNYTARWDTRTTGGALVPTGHYTVRLTFNPASSNGTEFGPGEGQGYLESSLNVTS